MKYVFMENWSKSFQNYQIHLINKSSDNNISPQKFKMVSVGPLDARPTGDRRLRL